MKFSLKKPDDNNNTKKRLGGFSLKKKTDQTPPSSKLQKSSVLFGEKADTDTLGKKVEITSTHQVNENKEEEELIIRPVVREGTWEHRKEQTFERLRKENEQSIKSNELGVDTATGKNNKARTAEELARLSLLDGEDLSTFTTPAIQLSTSSEEVKEATKESYEKVPVEKFGLAMLRGMGFKGKAKSTEINNKPKSSVMRPPLLGLGAKPSALQADPSYKKNTRSYIPVMMVNTETGERITEDEIKNERDRSPVRDRGNNYRERD